MFVVIEDGGVCCLQLNLQRRHSRRPRSASGVLPVNNIWKTIDKGGFVQKGGRRKSTRRNKVGAPADLDARRVEIASWHNAHILRPTILLLRSLN